MMGKHHSVGSSGPFIIGIDAGSVSVNGAVINQYKEFVLETPYKRHMGQVEEAVETLIQDLHQNLGKENIQSIAFTGYHGKRLSERLEVFYEYETISQVLGALYVKPDARTVISMGGQDTSLSQVNHHEGGWELAYFNANGPCASGTGSFIDQQAERLATALYERRKEIPPDHIDRILADFISLGLRSQKPADVACRCTVFTKSDMIHLQNKGERLEDIIYGLHVGNARNYMSTIVSNRVLHEPVLFIGGLSLNALQVKAFRKYFPRLIVPGHSTSIGALGVALQAFESGKEERADLIKLRRTDRDQSHSLPTGEKLRTVRTTFPEIKPTVRKGGHNKISAYLGVDVGSTTTKYALINKNCEIIHKRYVMTQGRPIEVTQDLLRSLKKDIGHRVAIRGVAVTGSGRNVVGDFLNADLVIDEITAHARGAVQIDPQVETVFEIGGQDAKFIAIRNAYPMDFDMNKVCAAGTGSFLHELANKYGINIVGEFEEIALSSEKPVKLAERCTVFMESDLVSYHQKGVAKRDLMAGLCYAIVHNYLNRVVGKRKIGERVMFLGGPSLNKAVVAAFENVLGGGLLVPQHREVLGAYGAAIHVQEKMILEGRTKSRFRGLESAVNDRMEFEERICRADRHCHNQCKLKIYNFGGRRSVWGGECGRYELTRSGKHGKQNLFEVRQRIWEQFMEGVYEPLGDKPVMEIAGRPTVGMQRALYGNFSSVLWAHFFDRLGFRLVLTPPTNRALSKAGIETVLAETCYPVKVSHGHVKALVGQTRYLFLPTMIDMSTPRPEEKGFLCPMVQSNSYMLQAALEMDQAGVLNPVIHLKRDPQTLALEIFEQLGRKLGIKKGQVRAALREAMDMQDGFRRALYREGRNLLERQPPDEPVVIVTGRPYNLHDERLNLRLGENLARIGIVAFPMDFIDASSVILSDLLPMYWGLGAQILKTARWVKSMPHYFGLHLTNFGCGADSFIEHFYKHIMGDKPYLILELDEHSAVAGVMTRLEAYKNVVENVMQKREADSSGDFNLALEG
jgi:predicted CoA-substrate-specific enzyme activase